MANEVIIEVKADTSNAQKGFEGVRVQAKLLESAFGSVGAVAGGFLVGRGLEEGLRSVREGLTSVVHSAEHSQDVTAQLNAVLASTGGQAGVTAAQVAGLSLELQKHSTFSDEAVTSAQNLLLTFTEIKSNVFPQTTRAVVDLSTALHQDLQSTAIQVGKALNDPIAGLTSLRRVGVSFSESQRELIKTLVESGDKLGAQRVILSELERQFGGSAAASADTFSGRLKVLGNQFDDIKEKIGFAVIGGFMKLSDWFSAHKDDVSAFFEKIRPVLDAVVDQFQTQLGGIIGIGEALVKSIEGLADFVSDIAHGRWMDAWSDLKDVAVNVGEALINELAALFGKIPNLLIDAMNVGIAEINKVKLPTFSPLGGPNLIPGGGGGFGIPAIPNIPTQPFSLSEAFKNLREHGEAAKTSTPPIVQLGEEAGATSKKLTSLGDALMGALSTIRSAASSLFGQPTREQAALQLRSDQLARDIMNQPAFRPGQSSRGPDLAAEKAKIDRRLADLDAVHKIDQDQLKLADRTLLSEDQLRRMTDTLVIQTKDLTGKFQATADAAGLHLIPSFDDAMNANLSLKRTLVEEVIPAHKATTEAQKEAAKEVWNFTDAMRNAARSLTDALGGAVAPDAPFLRP